MLQQASSLSMLRRTAHHNFCNTVCVAVSGQKLELTYGSVTRTRFFALLNHLASYWSSADRRIAWINGRQRSRRSAISVLAHPSAATALAAAAVASAAASSLSRPAIPSDTVSSCSSTATNAATAIATPPPPSSSSSSSSSSPASSSTSPSLEGSPVPWASLGPSLDVIQQRFRIGTATFRLMAPRDVDAVMDTYLENGLLDADPYWTRAWPSAIALAATLLQRPELVAGKVVADLGAGLGLAGMAAALAGAKEVVLLDREPAALQCALLSAVATGLDSDPDPCNMGSGFSNSDAAGTAARFSRERGRRVVEPLPADQRPSYAVLQLTLPYMHLLQLDEQQQEAQRDDEQEWEREWGVLVSMARALNRNENSKGAGQREDRPRTCVVDPNGPRTSTSSSSSSSSSSDDRSDSRREVASSLSCHSSKSLLTPSSSSSSSLLLKATASVWDSQEYESSRSSSSINDDASGSNSSSSCNSSSSSSSSTSVLRAHVFDWTAPPPMEQLLPPLPFTQQQQQQQRRGCRQKGAVRQRRFDVVLACDVLYEDAAVGPISALMPLLLEPDGGRLLLADPPNRTVRNRERFLEELRSGPLRLSVEECSLQQCEVSKLDNEMAGGLAPSTETVPVQFLVLRSSLGNDTVGLKL